jgi:hypothetical protein
MRRLIRNAPKKIFLILDDLRVHDAKPLKAWLAANKQHIEVFTCQARAPSSTPTR